MNGKTENSKFQEAQKLPLDTVGEFGVGRHAFTGEFSMNGKTYKGKFNLNVSESKPGKEAATLQSWFLEAQKLGLSTLDKFEFQTCLASVCVSSPAYMSAAKVLAGSHKSEEEKFFGWVHGLANQTWNAID